MYIEYELSESEKQIAKIYLKRAYMKKVIKLNSDKRNLKKSMGAFSLQISVSIVIVLIIFSVFYFSYIPFTPTNVITYCVSIFISLIIIGVIKPMVLDKLYLKHISILNNSYHCRRKNILSLDVYNYMYRTERVVNKWNKIRLNIDDATGEVVFHNGVTQVFDRQTMIHHDIFRGVSFYSFVDSKTNKRNILPIPCGNGNQEQFLMALL
ncbi:hypothetical protein [Citrobacter youngae]|uniref:Uncharacterized protein n=1 Tax=Citrobacter youngae ATCC 29220 TaxID=500640 RepID=D4BAX9_9ENTR|nr:hypothetical protein [Citrobacter youngae]EFE09340.1 hypothetical protein CIT292_07625 [Citrobacter youngae ATCC 29220]